MPQFLKWLIFIVLLAGYLWAVFFWERGIEPSDSNATDSADSSTMNETVMEEPTYSEDTTVYEGFSDSTIYESSYTEPTGTTSEETPEIQIDNVNSETVSQVFSGKYAVISGSYTNKAQADKALKQYLTKYGLSGEVVFYDPYYKVVLASSNTMSEAKSELSKITELGISAFIQKNP